MNKKIIVLNIYAVAYLTYSWGNPILEFLKEWTALPLIIITFFCMFTPFTNDNNGGIFKTGIILFLLVLCNTSTYYLPLDAEWNGLIYPLNILVTMSGIMSIPLWFVSSEELQRMDNKSHSKNDDIMSNGAEWVKNNQIKAGLIWGIIGPKLDAGEKIEDIIPQVLKDHPYLSAAGIYYIYNK